jgi:hypothetical protein
MVFLRLAVPHPHRFGKSARSHGRLPGALGERNRFSNHVQVRRHGASRRVSRSPKSPSSTARLPSAFPRLTGRRRSRTDQAWGYYTAQVLKSCVGRATTRAIKRGGPPGPVHATTPATLSGEAAHVPGLTSTPRTVGHEKPRLSDVLAPQPRQCQTQRRRVTLIETVRRARLSPSRGSTPARARQQRKE